MTDSTIDLYKLERLERRATPGPWKADTVWDNEHEPTEAFCMGPVHEVRREGASAFRAAEKDAELMSALRNAAPALFARLRAYRERIAELEEHISALECIEKAKGGGGG